MTLERELASIMRFTLEKSGNPASYYKEIPEGFIIPSVYFPRPDITSRGDTFVTYALEFAWNINFFHNDKVSAQAMAFSVFEALKAERNLVPLVDEDGGMGGRSIRLYDPELKVVDGTLGTALLALHWNSRRPYNDSVSPKVMRYNVSNDLRGVI